MSEFANVNQLAFDPAFPGGMNLSADPYVPIESTLPVLGDNYIHTGVPVIRDRLGRPVGPVVEEETVEGFESNKTNLIIKLAMFMLIVWLLFKLLNNGQQKTGTVSKLDLLMV